jgi:ketosteroid isomerase-like protein
MRQRHLLAPLAVVTGLTCFGQSQGFKPETIIALERAALDRWIKGDPQGYLETYGPEMTYFDPTTERRIDGLAAMKEYLVPFTGKIKIDRYEMIGATGQGTGDIAVLTYNLVNHVTRNGKVGIVRWNSTSVYGRQGSKWKLIHSHWSYTNPELKQPGGQ